MMKNVTGVHKLVPACPSHKSIALTLEERYGLGGKRVSGFWRCPVDNKVYQDIPDGFPK